MKVLKPGRDQDGWAREEECTGNGNGFGGCGAVLLVEAGDLFHTHSSHQGEVDHFITFKCIACGVLTDISSVPSYVSNNIPSSLGAWLELHPPANEPGRTDE